MLASGTPDRSEPPDGDGYMLEMDVLPPRPRTRGDCRNGIRPCPYVGCRHHLMIHVDEYGTLYLAKKRSMAGRRQAYNPNATPEGAALVEAWMEAVAEAVVNAEETCELDISEANEVKGVPFSRIGKLIGVGKQRAHQECMRALAKLSDEHGWQFEDLVDALVERGRL